VSPKPGRSGRAIEMMVDKERKFQHHIQKPSRCHTVACDVTSLNLQFTKNRYDLGQKEYTKWQLR
jgi:hypothetical protein